MSLHKIFLLLTSLLITGCATNNNWIKVEDFRDQVKPDAIIVPEIFAFKTRIKRPFIEFDQESGLLPCRYIADKRNELGVFYKGQGLCLFLRAAENERFYVYTGGIFVPHDPVDEPRIYRIFTGNVSYTDNIDTLLKSPEYNQSVTDSSQAVSEISNQIAMSKISTGGPMGAVVTGGVIGGAIVAAVIRADAGKHSIEPEIPDKSLVQKLRLIIKSRALQ